MKKIILNLDKSAIFETAKAFAIPYGSNDASRAWFPKSQCAIYRLPGAVDPNYMQVEIPLWLALQKIHQLNLYEGYTGQTVDN